jgi:hypothetical protein
LIPIFDWQEESSLKPCKTHNKPEEERKLDVMQNGYTGAVIGLNNSAKSNIGQLINQ